MADQNILDKSMRSVFVGNIPYEATEEKLKDIFNEVGPVISFKLVYDRETGKPKGYGFCEYKDQETALSAMRNLNGYEIGGRTLRVDNACTEKSRLEMQSLMMGMPTSESHYGDAVNSEKAPDIINNLVSTLPPEQLYELMKQMKECVQNNSVEARNMLLQNPQLGYALLQALVVMKIVDPEVAKTMMHAAHKIPPSPQIIRAQAMPQTSQMPCNNIQWKKPNSQMVQTCPPPDLLEWHHNMNIGRDTIPDLRQPPNHIPFLLPSTPVESSQSYPGLRDLDSRPFGDTFRDFKINSNFMSIPPPMIIPPPNLLAQNTLVPPQIVQPSQSQTQQQSSPSDTSDAEKAALIMQVLQLSDSQIAMLPAGQRQSIIQLKEKITLSSQKKD